MASRNVAQKQDFLPLSFHPFVLSPQRSSAHSNANSLSIAKLDQVFHAQRAYDHVYNRNSSSTEDHVASREFGSCNRFQHPALKLVLRISPRHLIMLYLSIFPLELSPPTPSLSLFAKHFQNRSVSSPAPVTTVCPSGLIAR